MKEIKTVIHIHAPCEYVWNTLMDFKAYPSWNPFIRSIEGIPAPGNSISVTMSPPGSKHPMKFTPSVIKSEANREFRWLGHLFIKGIFDGEHYFIFEKLPNGSTAVHHGERFGGVLTPFLKGVLKNTETGFKEMNVALKERCEENFNLDN